ncbi:class I SAM-dependent methyltransferase [Phenylobacterium soli]|uniref:class I SAM-dependent methyltransferase n=1 Tax=Phenylobacterium soli TaxID=2170551 RepID=UPI0014024680|nr:class I SAM-dependent methyltransferase [Phenylobacterium soli]
MTAAESHFAFGENWKSFLGTLDDERITQAEAGLRRLFPGGELKGKTFLDIGSGSGLSSLAALKLGVKSLVATDIDRHSVEATAGLLSRLAPGGPWAAEERSVFDLAPSDGRFDVVYSWGVLHHTGDMWRAVETAASMVKPGGLFAVALYRKTGMCGFWKIEKRFYSRAPRWAQTPIRWAYMSARFVTDFIRFKPIIRTIRNYRSQRGMSWSHDAHDWLGGYPYESAAPPVIRERISAMGFSLEREFLRPAGLGLWGSGCDEFVFRKR